MTVAELMVGHDDLPLVTDDQTMDQVILVLSEKNLGAVLVVDDKGVLQGLVTDGDLKRHMGPDLLQKPVSNVMSTSPKTISSDILAVQALDIMTKTPGQYLTSLIVMDDGVLKGMIRLQDCLRAGLA
jgi:arabinose-5-phosphate isomerase